MLEKDLISCVSQVHLISETISLSAFERSPRVHIVDTLTKLMG